MSFANGCPVIDSHVNPNRLLIENFDYLCLNLMNTLAHRWSNGLSYLHLKNAIFQVVNKILIGLLRYCSKSLRWHLIGTRDKSFLFFFSLLPLFNEASALFMFGMNNLNVLETFKKKKTNARFVYVALCFRIKNNNAWFQSLNFQCDSYNLPKLICSRLWFANNGSHDPAVESIKFSLDRDGFDKKSCSPTVHSCSSYFETSLFPIFDVILPSQSLRYWS